jgi:hypothetical protein
MASLKDCGSKAMEPVFWERCPLGGRISRPHVDKGISLSLLGEPLGPVAQWGTCLDEARAFIAGVRSPPLHGVDDPSQDGLGGKPRDNAKGGFLGGTHSVRPPGKAVRMPRHFIPTRCVAERAGPSRDMPR